MMGMTKISVKPHCVYCGATDNLMPSSQVPDGTLYPGTQRMCKSTDGCILRIHGKFHGKDYGPSPDCPHCERG